MESSLRKKICCISAIVIAIMAVQFMLAGNIYAAKKSQTITIDKTSMTAYKTTDLKAKSTAGQTGDKLTYTSVTPDKLYVDKDGKVFGKQGSYKIKITAPETKKYAKTTKTFTLKFTNNLKEWKTDVTVTSDKCGQLTICYNTFHGADEYVIEYKKDGAKKYTETKPYSVREGKITAKKGDKFTYAKSYKLTRSGFELGKKYQIRMMARYDDGEYIRMREAKQNGKVVTKTVTVKTHKYGAYQTTKAATCEKAGEKQRKCEYCGSVQKQTIKALGHDMKKYPKKNPTCTEPGNEAYEACTRCSKSTKKIIPALGHNYASSYTVDKKASFDHAGQKSRHCSRCSSTTGAVTIQPVTAKLNRDKFVWNGYFQAPTAVVDGISLGKDYTFTVPGSSSSVGTYDVVVKLTGAEYEGSKVLKYKIMPTKASLKKVKSGKKKVKVIWTPIKAMEASGHITGYQVQIAKNRSFKKGVKTKTIKNYARGNCLFKKLKSKKTYYARVRSYVQKGNTRYYSGWSTVKKAKTK